MPEVADSAHPSQQRLQLPDNNQQDVDKGETPRGGGEGGGGEGRPLDNDGMQEQEGGTDGLGARQGEEGPVQN